MWAEKLAETMFRPSAFDSLIERVPPTRWQRIKWAVTGRIYNARMWLASKIAGFDVTERNDDY
jgi:hypothetical protein